jgi:hypothetical protein
MRTKDETIWSCSSRASEHVAQGRVDLGNCYLQRFLHVAIYSCMNHVAWILDLLPPKQGALLSKTVDFYKPQSSSQDAKNCSAD